MDKTLIDIHRAIVEAKRLAAKHPEVQRRLDIADRSILACGYLLAEQDRRRRRRHLRVHSARVP